VQRSDLRLKFLSLAMAAALLFVIRGERRVAFTLTVPTAVKLPRGLEAADPLPETLRISLAGPWSRLRTLDANDVGPVTIDLSRTGHGRASWFVRPESLHLPAGVHVESLSPSQGTVEVQRDRP
jgi:hypothetical protein